MILKNGSQAYNAWVLPPAPVYISFYLFDLVNMKEVISSGAKPHVVQRGPYTYRLVYKFAAHVLTASSYSEIRPRENITFHDNGTISFLQAKSYVFAPERSNGTENDTFTGVNLPLLVGMTSQRLETTSGLIVDFGLSRPLPRAKSAGFAGIFTASFYKRASLPRIHRKCIQ